MRIDKKGKKEGKKRKKETKAMERKGHRNERDFYKFQKINNNYVYQNNFQKKEEKKV